MYFYLGDVNVMKIYKSFFLTSIFFLPIISQSFFAQNSDYVNYKRDGIHYPEELLTEKDSLKWPIKLDLSLKIEEIKNISIDNSYFESNMWYEIDSDYPEVFITSSGKPIKLNPITDNWVFLSGISIEKPKEKEKVLIFDENNKYCFSRSNQLFMTHKWNLRSFPFDTQKLKFSFLTQYDTSVVRINNSPNKEFRFNDNNEFLPDGYKIKKMYFEKKFIVGNEKILVSPNNKREIVFEKLTYILELSRNGSWLYIKLFFGGFVSFLISWMIFLVPKSQFESRTNIAVASIFGALGNKYFIEQSLPNVQVLMKADIINNLVILLIVLNILIMIAQSNKKLKFLRIKSNKRVMVISAIIFIFSNLLVLIL